MKKLFKILYLSVIMHVEKNIANNCSEINEEEQIIKKTDFLNKKTLEHKKTIKKFKLKCMKIDKEIEVQKNIVKQKDDAIKQKDDAIKQKDDVLKKEKAEKEKIKNYIKTLGIDPDKI